MLDHIDRCHRSPAFLALIGFALIVATPAVSRAQWWQTPLPPWQQASGPGGSDYPWAQATTTQYVNAKDGALTYWIVAPTQWRGIGSAPTQLPLVVFLHGWGANDPIFYQLWINHLARKGRIVVFPAYQTATTLPIWFASNAIASTQQAITKIGLGTPGTNGLFIDPIAGMTVVGHSFGASTGINVAARYATSRLPEPRVVFLVSPVNAMIDANLSGLPATALLECTVGNADDIAGRAGCDTIWDRTTHLRAANRNYIWMYSDSHGLPALVADHFVPVFPTALDFHGLWKLGDALVDCAVYQSECASAVGGGFQQTDMGVWSDGAPVHPLSVTTQKPGCPSGSRAAGC